VTDFSLTSDVRFFDLARILPLTVEFSGFSGNSFRAFFIPFVTLGVRFIDLRLILPLPAEFSGFSGIVFHLILRANFS
jgi:hypothetical protein